MVSVEFYNVVRWKEYKQPSQQEIKNQINGETGRNGIWFPEDGDSCYKTG
jgi:hypothetical protein